MDFLDAAILGLLQGIMGFFPLSMSGHYIVLREWLNIDSVHMLAYGAFLHFSVAAATILYFSSDLWTIVQALLRKLGRLPVNARDLVLFYALALGTIPAALLGFFIGPALSNSFQTVGIVATMLFISSVFLMYVEWRYYIRPIHTGITTRLGLLVGLFQVLSLIPGFSNTGATIAGGMLVGMSRYEAARFTFLLTIPLSIGAGSRQFIELLRTEGVVDWTAVIVGSTVAAVAAFCTVHIFLYLMRRHTLWPFIWYSVILAALIGYVSLVAG